MALQNEADFPPGLTCLKNVDTLLRCPICFDFLNITVMTKCSHNFCSLCIRKFFSYKLQCPVCNMQATEQDLRNNRLLDDLVLSFQAARQQLSKINFESPPISPKAPAAAVRSKTLREKSLKSSSAVLSQFFIKKPKESKQDAAATPFIKEEPMDVEEPSVQHLMPVKQEDTPLQIGCLGEETAHCSSPSEDVKPVIQVDCPVCSVRVAQHFINKHLDMCLNRGEKKESLRSALGKARRPMAKLVYNLLSLQELKKKLKDCHLPMQGSRDRLIKRHQEFVHIYNAQCDSLDPKSVEDIAKEVEANEKMRNKLQEKKKPVMVFSKNLSEKEIDEMHSNYRKQHCSDFTRLMDQVRGRLQTTRSAGIKQAASKGEDVNSTLSADSKDSMVIYVEDSASEEEQCAREILSPSSSCSDVSISSSLSDIFGPESPRKLENPETLGKRKPSSSRQDKATALSILGKRRRKT